uniref:CLIP domain-containing serine protease n=1 Tax=Anopheles minimus TaxID=112268 RepID=A0A182W9F1_9DIPT
MKHIREHSTWRICCGVVSLMMVVQCYGQESEPCSTPNGTAGRCIKVRDCGYVLDLMRKDNFRFNDTEYLEQLQCGIRPDGLTLVCCPQVTNDPQCGPSSFVVRVMGGNDTEIGEYPWLALLRFQARNREIKSNCGGSLIAKRFVLTAAHCYTSAKKKLLSVHSVRLAEWNFNNHRSRKDCKQLKDYDIPICRKDYEVERFVLHPQYRVSHGVHLNDIALIELATDVEYNVFVAPICLPVDVPRLPPDDIVKEYTAAGWGSTEQSSGMSNHLMQLCLSEWELVLHRPVELH